MATNTRLLHTAMTNRLWQFLEFYEVAGRATWATRPRTLARTTGLAADRSKLKAQLANSRPLI